MLDENRIRLMTRMASYEENEGKKAIPIAGYFRGDYISLNVVLSAICVTIAFAMIAGLYIYYNMETILADVYRVDLVGIGRMALTAYVIVLVIYALISYVVYSYRYDKAKKSIQGYYQALRKLSSVYEDEEL